jgi:N-acetylglucosamine-6-sulfatase
MAEKATAFIKQTAENLPHKPFFLYLAPYAPHAPATPPPRYENAFPGAKAPRTAAFNEADVTDKPLWVRRLKSLSKEQIAEIDDLHRKRLQSMLAVEDMVSDVIDALTTTGKLGTTYVFFASDNGFHQGQHRLHSGKNTAFSADLAVPLVVRGPGIPKGQVVTKITANVDYAATWSELAGIEIRKFVDGRSLVPFLTGKTPATWRNCLLLEHGGPSLTAPGPDGVLEPQDPFDIQAQSVGGPPVFAGLRTWHETFLEYDTGEGELYDHATDPAELTNLYETSSPGHTKQLSNWLGTLRHAAGDALRTAEEGPPAP